jgi:heavy metal translocating P-type ATPase
MRGDVRTSVGLPSASRPLTISYHAGDLRPCFGRCGTSTIESVSDRAREDPIDERHRPGRRLASTPEALLLVGSVTLTGAGGLLHAVGLSGLGDASWALTAVIGAIAATAWVLDAVRHGRLGVDVVSIMALAGSLLVDELLAGAVIAVMLASGRALEAQADGRARRELRSLLERAPRVAHRYDGDELTSWPVGEVVTGDLLLVRPGEVVPVDGLLEGAPAVLDESALTGEPLPVERASGDSIRSGTTNAGGPFDLRATTNADESTYAGIIRLVGQAQASSSPFVRLADRFAVVFLTVSVALAGAAWLISGDPVRAVAVLVVATPCPLILAAPVAMVSGLARAAKRGVVIKGGGALERLAGAEVLLFDKTGTLTEGRPTVADIVTDGEIRSEEVLRLAASLDQVSPHVLASAIVRAAHEQHLALTLPTEVEEVPGHGVRGRVGSRSVAVGKASWLLRGTPPAWTRSVRRRADLDGALTMLVAVDGDVVAAIVLDDPIRTDAARTIRDLRRQGLHSITMVTGDREDVARTVGAMIGVDEVLADCTPAEKVEAVRRAGQDHRTIMVGDGINDAPALALADVGVAIGARGSTASSEAADVVLTTDRLSRLGEAITIARRTRRITRQSVYTGVGLSALAMVAAALGLLPPTAGALLQEAIDVTVILNALRVLRTPPGDAAVGPDEQAVVERFAGEHTTLRPDLDRLRATADQIGTQPIGEVLPRVRSVQQFLVEELLPHEQAEDARLYPVFDRVLGGSDPTGTMSRAHLEIARHVRRIGHLLDDIDPVAPDPEDLIELRRTLYGLHAILVLHFAQEDEGYLGLVDWPQLAGPR